MRNKQQWNDIGPESADRLHFLSTTRHSLQEHGLQCQVTLIILCTISIGSS